MTGTASVLRANSRTLPLADNTVDLVVTSPPYFALRSYQDEELCLRCIDAKREGRNVREMWPDYAEHAAAEHNKHHYAGQIGDEPTPAEFVASLLDVTRECVRVLKPSGSLWVNLGDKYVADNRGSGFDVKRREAKHAPRGPLGYITGGMRQKSLMGIPWRYALACIDDLGLILRAEVIWAKPNGLPESVTDRVRRSHEQWFHFTLEPRYFSAVDEIREPYTSAPARAQKSKATSTGAHRNPTTLLDHDLEHNPLGKLPGSVWTVPTEPLRVPDHLGIDHFAAFPSEWPRRIIKGWSPDGGVVLDPFGGTGTTAMVAKALGRHGITVDMSADYCRLAAWRTTDPGQLAKALGGAKAKAAKAALAKAAKAAAKIAASGSEQLDLFGEVTA